MTYRRASGAFANASRGVAQADQVGAPRVLATRERKIEGYKRRPDTKLLFSLGWNLPRAAFGPRPRGNGLSSERIELRSGLSSDVVCRLFITLGNLGGCLVRAWPARKLP